MSRKAVLPPRPQPVSATDFKITLAVLIFAACSGALVSFLLVPEFTFDLTGNEEVGGWIAVKLESLIWQISSLAIQPD